MRNLKGLLSALLLLVFIAPCAEAADITLRFAGQFPDGHYATKLMRDIAGGVNQRTNGRIAIEVYPANKLGDYTLVYEDLMKGRVDMALITNSGQFDPRLELPNPTSTYSRATRAPRRISLPTAGSRRGYPNTTRASASNSSASTLRA